MDQSPQIEEEIEPASRAIALQIFGSIRGRVARVRRATNANDSLAALSELVIQIGASEYLALGETLKDKRVRSVGKMLGNLQPHSLDLCIQSHVLLRRHQMGHHNLGAVTQHYVPQMPNYALITDG